MNARIKQTIAAHQRVIADLDTLTPKIIQLAARVRDSFASGGKVLLMGNGGSAADSQHIAAELVGRFHRQRLGLPALALTTDTSILTSVGNDYGFEQIFARQVEALARPGDVLIGISTSGSSENVVAAIRRGQELNIWSAGLLGGSGGRLQELCDLALVVPSEVTPRIQEAHILIGHILCDLVEAD
ncbi:MAG: D-sedoheptulose 7-phosphate isomerase [Thiobacillaceae bacterium]